MPVSSLLVKVNAKKEHEVATKLRAIQHVEVTDIIGNHIVVVTDTQNSETDRDIWNTIELLPGVAQLSLVYHNFEDLEKTQCQET